MAKRENSMLHCVWRVVLLLASPSVIPVTTGNLLGMVRNTTDPTCLQRRVQCSSLAAITADGTTLPRQNDVAGPNLIQALQVVAGSVSYSIATDPNANATGSNTVLVSVDVPTGTIVATVALPFVRVGMLAEGMFVHYDAATKELLVVGEMETPPPSLPHATAGDHVVFRVNPRAGTMVAVGFFGGDDGIANVGAYDATSRILWAQCIYGNGRTYSLLGMDTRSGAVTHNVTDPYMAGGMACSVNGRCFLIGITHLNLRPGASFERVLVELSCSDNSGNSSSGTGGNARLSCTISSTPLLRLPNVCIMLGGLMTIESKSQIIYSVLQNSSATSPCSGSSSSSDIRSAAAGTVGNNLVVWRPRKGRAAAVATDTGFKLLVIDFSTVVPAVVGEPVLCASVMLCPISISARV